MPPIKKPMLAGVFDEAKAVFPYLVTPKIDGIRFIMVGGAALSRTFKPIRNKHVQDMLSTHLPDGVDGELTCGDTFQSSTSSIMSASGKPDFTAWLFDYVPADGEVIPPYEKRMQLLDKWRAGVQLPFSCTLLTKGVRVNSVEEVRSVAGELVDQGYEGAMLRSPAGTYKFGRATQRENTLLKVKGFQDAEATVIGFQEKMSNENKQERDAFGRSKRSHCKDGLVACNTLGALCVQSYPLSKGYGTFKIGSGFNDEQRAAIWANKSAYLGKIVKYKFFDVSVKDKPRHPIFLGWRDPDDM